MFKEALNMTDIIDKMNSGAAMLQKKTRAVVYKRSAQDVYNIVGKLKDCGMNFQCFSDQNEQQ